MQVEAPPSQQLLTGPAHHQWGRSLRPCHPHGGWGWLWRLRQVSALFGGTVSAVPRRAALPYLSAALVRWLRPHLSGRRQRRRPEAAARARTEYGSLGSWPEPDKLPIVYSPVYNIGFFGLEKLHPFDSKKYAHVCVVGAGAGSWVWRGVQQQAQGVPQEECP